MNILVLSEEYVKSGHHDMDSLREQPTPAWSKIGYQGIRSYGIAANPSLRREEKLNESGFIFFTQVRKLKKINLIRSASFIIFIRRYKIL